MFIPLNMVTMDLNPAPYCKGHYCCYGNSPIWKHLNQMFLCPSDLLTCPAPSIGGSRPMVSGQNCIFAHFCCWTPKLGETHGFLLAQTMKSPLFGCLNLHFRWLNLHFRWLNLRFSWLNLRFSLAKWHFFLANHRRKPKRRSSPRPRRPLPARQRLWRWGFTGHGAPYAPLSAEIYICIYICMYVCICIHKIQNT